MNLWKVGVGIALFLSSAMIVQVLDVVGVSLLFNGIDYAPDFTAKILDTLAGSLIIWGILDIRLKNRNKNKRKCKS